MALTEKQKEAQRKYYREVRQHDELWKADNNRRRAERRERLDPNIEREYHAERYFRFSGQYARGDLWHGLVTCGVDWLRNPKFVFVVNGKRRFEHLAEPLPTLGEGQHGCFADMAGGLRVRRVGDLPLRV